MSTMPGRIPPEHSVLPPDEGKGYGFFGYRGAMCDRAIRADNAAMLSECVDREFIDSESTMLYGETVREHCERVAPQCAEMLRARGWK